MRDGKVGNVLLGKGSSQCATFFVLSSVPCRRHIRIPGKLVETLPAAALHLCICSKIWAAGTCSHGG